MTDSEKQYSMNRQNFIAPDSIFGDPHSYDEGLSVFNEEQAAQGFRGFSEHSMDEIYYNDKGNRQKEHSCGR